MTNTVRCGGWIAKLDGIEFVAEPFHGEGQGYFISAEAMLTGLGRIDWLQHMREKIWFTKQVERDFLEGFYLIMTGLYRRGDLKLEK